MTKKLYRSDKDKVLAGVIGGLGEYFEIDPTILRLAFVLLLIVTGFFPTIIGYIVAVVIVPNKPTIHHMPASEYKEKKEEEVKNNA